VTRATLVLVALVVGFVLSDVRAYAWPRLRHWFFDRRARRQGRAAAPALDAPRQVQPRHIRRQGARRFAKDVFHQASEAQRGEVNT
jgi:hypothetical protein